MVALIKPTWYWEYLVVLPNHVAKPFKTLKEAIGYARSLHLEFELML